MVPDIEGLKAYIGSLVLELFSARGEIRKLSDQLAEEKNKKSEPKHDAG